MTGPMETTSATSDSPLLHSEVHYVDSNCVGAELKLLIGKCGLKEGTPPVVLYLPDADFCFGSAVNMLWAMQFLDWLPPMLVVGIGYRVSHELETLAPRSRDLTPSIDKETTETFGWEAGGAPRFHSFIKDELKPWVTQRFGVDADDDVFFGHSYGGLFGAYVLLTEPETFKRYGLGSASLWYDHWSIFEREAAYAATHDDMAAQVFLSVGEHEGPEGDRLQRAWLPEEKRADAEAEAAAEAASYGVVDPIVDQERLVRALRSRNYASLELASEVFPSEFHMTVGQLNLSRSLRHLFGAPC
jgi:predicted alpha/beta superfamily hydrolase